MGITLHPQGGQPPKSAHAKRCTGKANLDGHGRSVVGIWVFDKVRSGGNRMTHHCWLQFIHSSGHVALYMAQVPPDMHTILKQRIVDRSVDSNLHAAHGWSIGRGSLLDNASSEKAVPGEAHKHDAAPARADILARQRYLQISVSIYLLPQLHNELTVSRELCTCREAQHMPAELFTQASHARTEEH